MNMSSQGDSFQGDCSRGDLAQEDSSPYFKKPNNISTTSTRVSSSSVAASVYGKSAFFGNQTASNPSTPGPNRSRISAENKSLTYTSNDRTLAGNKSSPYSSSTSLAKHGSSSNTLASYGSTSTVSDFNINKRKGRNSFDTSSLATPGRSRGNNTTVGNNSSFYGEPVNADCIVAIVEGRGSARGEVGLASISLSSPTLIICQFSDTRTYVRTLTKIAVLNPSDIITPNGISSFSNADPSMTKLYSDVAGKFPVASIIEVHRKYFSETRGLQMVKHLCALEYSSVELQLRHKYYALAAAACLLKYVEFIENIIYAPKSLKVEFQASTDAMIIDVDTAKHVELLSSSMSKKKESSLYGVLNKCSTPGGSKLLRATLFQPPIKEDIIEDRLDAVAELVKRPEVLSSVQATLGRMCNLDTLLSLCAILPKTDTLPLVEKRINQVIGLKHALELIPNLVTSLSADLESPLLLQILEVLKNEAFPEMLESIKSVINEEARVAKGAAAMRLQRCFAIKSGVRDLLDIARQTYCELVKDIETMVGEFSEKQGMPMRVGFNAQRGYHIQMHKSTLISLKGRGFKVSQLPPEFINPKQNNSLISFTTENIVKIDQQSQGVLREITLMSNVIIQELICTLRTNIGSLYRLTEATNCLDLMTAFADVSSDPAFVRPRFGPVMHVKSSRHPILDKMDLPGSPDIISNDITATPIEANFQVITGPNMSGKSTYLKQIVLLQVMAQSGCFVPAFNEPQPMFRMADSIFSRVGMSDSIECNASTFAMEMKETAYILNSLGASSLVIIDELGRGTSPEEGAALCWAISEALAKTSSFTFLATHFRLLTKMESISIGIVNSCFVTELREGGGGHNEGGANEKDGTGGLVHTHKIVRGQLDIASGIANYGLHLARKVAVPEAVLNKANDIINDIRANEIKLPEVSEEDIMRLNCLRLAMTLQKLANKDDIDMEEKVETAKQLQKHFASIEDDDDYDEEDVEEVGDMDQDDSNDDDQNFV